MKKNPRGEDPKRQPRRLRLSRETIQALEPPALLEHVRGGGDEAGGGTYSHPELTTC